jgi:hypothetical protein
VVDGDGVLLRLLEHTMDLAAHDLSNDAVRVGAARNLAGRFDALAAVHVAVEGVDRAFELVVERWRRRGALVDEAGEVRVELFFEVGRVRAVAAAALDPLAQLGQQLIDVDGLGGRQFGLG